jgi:hypothetical protein
MIAIIKWVIANKDAVIPKILCFEAIHKIGLYFRYFFTPFVVASAKKTTVKIPNMTNNTSI